MCLDLKASLLLQALGARMFAAATGPDRGASSLLLLAAGHDASAAESAPDCTLLLNNPKLYPNCTLIHLRLGGHDWAVSRAPNPSTRAPC